MPEIVTQIQLIIERSHANEEGFLIDSKKAAEEIVKQFLKEEKTENYG